MNRDAFTGQRRIVVIERAAESTTALLAGHGFEPIVFSDNGAAISAIVRSPPGAVIADWTPPGLQLTELLGALRRAGLSTPTLVVSDSRMVDAIDVAFRAGADDYAAKPLGAELIARLRRLVENASKPQLRSFGRLSVDLVQRTVTVRAAGGDAQELILTRVEKDLLFALAERWGEDVAIAELLDRVWGTSKAVQPHVVEVAVHRLRAKLAESRAMLVRASKGCYRLGPKGGARSTVATL